MAHGIFVVACRILHCGVQASLVVARGLLSSCGTWAPELMGSVVGARGLSSCGVWALGHWAQLACEILVP